MFIDALRKRRVYLFRPKFLITILFLVIAFFTVIQDRFIEKRVMADGYVRVKHINDGDTVRVIIGNIEERVRLIGIDAPELAQVPWGRRAKRKLQEIIRKTDKTVRIELDVVERDKYGRLLAYLWTKDGKLINEEMVRSGHALLYTVPPNVRYVGRLKEAEEKARRKRVGIWGENGPVETPSEYRKTHPRY